MKRLKPLIIPPLPALAALLLGLAAHAAQPPRFAGEGVQLAGHQFPNDAAFFLLDWDADGKLDIVLPMGSMLNFSVALNRGTATQPVFGHVIPYDLNSTEMVPQTVEHASAWTFGDLNDDGLPDLVLFDGYLRLAVNAGTPQGPTHWQLWPDHPTYFPGSARMVEENARFSTGPESMNWKRGIFARQAVTLAIADWDGDGLNDLLVSRFKDEAPGVASAGQAGTQWTALGRMIAGAPAQPPPADAKAFDSPLPEAPARGLYLYRNLGSRGRPWFDDGVEVLTTEGRSVVAPNPELVDVDGDGIPDIVSSEVAYACNAYRVDWPTEPHVVWYRRTGAGADSRVEPARPLRDTRGAPVPAGVAARLADLRGTGAADDLLVLDPARGIRWYRRAARAGGGEPAFDSMTVISGREFARFNFNYQPLIADWSGPGTRDLILHGTADHHCKWGLRRTARYRARATAPGATPDYDFVGWVNYRGDLEMVPKALEDHQMAMYGAAAWAPEVGDGKARLLMSVEGLVYLFTDLAEDGLTFRERQRLAIPMPGRNRMTGTREISVSMPGGVRYIRLTPGGGKGNLGDSGLHLVAFEALVNGENVATWERGARVAPGGARRAQAMLTPGNAPDSGLFTSFTGPGTVVLPAIAAVDTLRLRLYDGSGPAAPGYLPFYWQGRLYPHGFRAEGELWYQYKIEVSTDGTQWTTVEDRLSTELLRSFPCAVDWNGDGKFDLVLGVLNGNGLTPATREYRLYLNRGDNDRPVFDSFEPLRLEDGAPLEFKPMDRETYRHQVGIIARDLNGDGRPDLVVEETPTSLTHYENVSDRPGGVRFRKIGNLGEPQPIRHWDEKRTFYVGDVDGDGIADIINNNSASIYMFAGPVLFRGLAADAPEPAATSAAAPNPSAARRVVLRNGAPHPSGEGVYGGNTAAVLDGGKPAVASVTAQTLPLRAYAHAPTVILLRFDDIPADAPLGAAVLEMTVPADGMTWGPLTSWVTCGAVRDDWDPQRATYAEAAPGRPWAERELIAGGVFLSRMEHIATVQAAPVFRFDVTAAVRAAQRAGRDRVSLILRRDYTGKYSIGNGYTFAGATHPTEDWRPRLILTGEP